MLAGTHTAVYALTAFPGHHASADFYGGYCFVNHAALAVAMLRAAGRRPFLIDVDYHAGDGSADILGSGHAAARGMCSIHALHDYPYIDPSAPWAVLLPPVLFMLRGERRTRSDALASCEWPVPMVNAEAGYVCLARNFRDLVYSRRNRL